MKKVFGIQLECKADEKNPIINNTVGAYNYYYCDITGKNVEAILNADMQEVQTKVQTFCKEWQEAKIKDEGLVSAKESLISMLEQGWASGNQVREAIMKDIEKNFEITSHSEKFLMGECSVTSTRIDDTGIETIMSERKTAYNDLQNYCNEQFGKDACKLIDNSALQDTVTYREDVTLTFKIPVADAKEETKDKVEKNSQYRPT